MMPARLAAEPTIVETALCGVALVCDPSGALYLPGERLLVVSDLHLEKGAAFARRRMLLPPWDTAATLARLAAVIDRFAPLRVVSLGDSFHDGEGAAAMPDPFRAALVALMAGRDWLWIAGNHDPEPPAGLPGDTLDECALGPLVLRHAPRAGRVEGEIAGHIHPAARLVVRGQSVRRPCFAEDGARLVMPAFGAYAGSVDIAAPQSARLFDWTRLVAHLIGQGRLYSMPAARLARAGVSRG